MVNTVYLKVARGVELNNSHHKKKILQLHRVVNVN